MRDLASHESRPQILLRRRRETSFDHGDTLDLDQHLRTGETGYRDQRARGKVVAKNFLSQLDGAVAVAAVGDKHRHRHDIGQTTARLLERPTQAGENLENLA